MMLSTADQAILQASQNQAEATQCILAPKNYCFSIDLFIFFDLKKKGNSCVDSL